MIIYEITAIVRREFIESYEKYMCERHIPDLLATGYFRAAEMARSSENRYRIRYIAADRKSLDEYLENFANRLREDFLVHFPEGIEVEREIWEILQGWEK